MNSHLKILSSLAIGGLLAGSALAGPSDAYSAFMSSRAVANSTVTDNSRPVSIALFRNLFRGNGLTPTSAENCPMVQVQSRVIPLGGQKGAGVTVTDYKFPGCVGTSVGTMSCKGSKASCATMLHGN